MAETTSSGANDRPEKDVPPTPTGGVDLTEERLRLLAPQWEAIRRGLRSMDRLQLGETEPATLFVWRLGEQ